jgi:ribosomal protein S18 acetylase RimI-like enzyme
MKIASKMIQTAIQKISEIGGEILHGYTAKTHIASINLHKSLGFVEKPCVQFDNLIHGDEQTMLEYEIEREYNVIPATVEEAQYVFWFYTQNIEALHGKFISLTDLKEIISKKDPDEANYLICKGAMPVAWLRINGLSGDDIAWISMLAVCDKFNHRGIGTYAVKFAEEYAKSKGFVKMGIRTTEDNIAAQSLYKKCGYVVNDYGDCTTGDGVARKGYGFEKILNTGV